MLERALEGELEREIKRKIKKKFKRDSKRKFEMEFKRKQMRELRGEGLYHCRVNHILRDLDLEFSPPLALPHPVGAKSISTQHGSPKEYRD